MTFLAEKIRLTGSFHYYFNSLRKLLKECVRIENRIEIEHPYANYLKNVFHFRWFCFIFDATGTSQSANVVFS